MTLALAERHLDSRRHLGRSARYLVHFRRSLRVTMSSDNEYSDNDYYDDEDEDAMMDDGDDGEYCHYPA